MDRRSAGNESYGNMHWAEMDRIGISLSKQTAPVFSMCTGDQLSSTMGQGNAIPSHLFSASGDLHLVRFVTLLVMNQGSHPGAWWFPVACFLVGVRVFEITVANIILTVLVTKTSLFFIIVYNTVTRYWIHCCFVMGRVSNEIISLDTLLKFVVSIVISHFINCDGLKFRFFSLSILVSLFTVHHANTFISAIEWWIFTVMSFRGPSY